MDKKAVLIDYLINNKDKFYRIALMHVHNEADAYDIVSEATVKAFTKIYLLRNLDAINSWFYRILIRCIYDNTNQKKRIYLFEDHEEENIEDKKDIKINDQIALSTEIQKLPQKYQTVILLKYYENMTFEEVSTILKIPESTVKSRTKKALEILRKEGLFNE